MKLAKSQTNKIGIFVLVGVVFMGALLSAVEE